jgi:hypothetical protein
LTQCPDCDRAVVIPEEYVREFTAKAAIEPPAAEESPSMPVAAKPTRMSGAEIAGRLRQARREKRLEEKGY